jgi:hypothetical protein
VTTTSSRNALARRAGGWRLSKAKQARSARQQATRPPKAEVSTRSQEQLGSGHSALKQELTPGGGREVNLLTNPDLSPGQRRDLAVQIGRLHGNLHLQRLLDGARGVNNKGEILEGRQGTVEVQRNPDAGVPFPAGVAEAPQTGAMAESEPEIPAELLTSVDFASLSTGELQDRLASIQETLSLFNQSTAETVLLQEQADQIEIELAWRLQVEAEVEAFLDEFTSITVIVRWSEQTETQCVEREEEVAVHPPYFMNVPDRAQAAARTLQRHDAAVANRQAAVAGMRDFVTEISRSTARGGMGLGRALVGKSHPGDIQTILQNALDRNLVPAGAGRDRPDGEDLRNWLVRYGIGIDCSGFVSQALNRVLEGVYGRPLEANERLNHGSGQLRGGARGFTQIQNTDELRPGDTMHIPGHIRVIMSTRRGEDGVMVFTTAEAHAGRGDIGPDRADWRYHNNRLQIRRSPDEAWTNSREGPTYGRYDRLQQAMEDR